MTTQTHPQPVHHLDDELVQRCRVRAAVYDRDNRFFSEDFDEISTAGYLSSALPATFGGAGATLAEVVRSQRRLAAAAPPTALALTMHLYMTGAAAELYGAGDRSVTTVLEEAAAGHVFAAGHAETGNDLPVLLSTTRAERVPGGFCVTGRKRFGSLGPVWTRLGIHALVGDAPDGPKVIHAFVCRDADGVQVLDQWDTLGMRATQSFDTVLDHVFVPDDHVVRILPAGDPDDPWFATMSAWAFLQLGAVYLGIADRALELAVENAHTKSSIAIPRGAMAYNPEIQHAVSEMYIDRLVAGTLLEVTADDWTGRVPHADWPARLLAAKKVAVDAAHTIVERAQEIVGGAAIATGNELERLYRDVRCGWFNGVNGFLTAELIGKGALGVEPQPRW
jgi:alkylation response protein AidB-like acyl-CoA dehydrogenase